MSLTAVVPKTDAEWAREVNRRLYMLENKQEVRAGQFVIADRNGNLVAAMQDGQQVDLIGHAESSAAAAVAPIKKVVDQQATAWQGALNQAGVQSPEQFIQSLQGLVPAAIQQAGATVALNANQFVNNLNGTVSYIGGQIENGVSNLVAQTDGTFVAAAQMVQGAASAALANGSASFQQAVAAGQQIADQGIAALQAEAVKAGQNVELFGNLLSQAFTGWYNNWAGAQASQAGSADVSAAAKAAADQAAAQAALTAQIASQLPRFYGGTGTSGLSASQSFSGLTSLPAGWTQVSCPLATSTAKYNTPATTNSQTVTGIWSTQDPFPKFLILRASSDFTYMVYARVQDNVYGSLTGRCEIGCLVGGVKTVLDTFDLPSAYPYAGTVQANKSYAFSATDYAFTLTGPGGLSRTYTDSLHVSQMGALYVYGGFATNGTVIEFKGYGTAGSYSWIPATTPTSGEFLDIIEHSGGLAGPGQSTYGGPWEGRTLTWGTDLATSATITGTNVSGGTATINVPGYGTITSLPGTNPDLLFTYNSRTVGAYASGTNLSAAANFQHWHTRLPGSMLSWSFYDSGPTTGPAGCYVAATEATGSTSWADLTTTSDQVTVNIGPSGLAIVLINVGFAYNISLNGQNQVSFATSGANTVAAGTYSSIMQAVNAGGGTMAVPLIGVFLVTGLLPGATTFKMKYKIAVNTGYFAERRMGVIPL